jgi:uncharacterized iron-regulated membrane protein
MASTARLLNPRTMRIWCRVHTWTSLICTLVLLVLCLSGLPLVFEDELDHWLSGIAEPAEASPDAPRIGIDRAVDIARARIPDRVVQFIWPDKNEPIWQVRMGASVSARDFDAIVSIDAHTGSVLGVERDFLSPVMAFILKLHTELFAGQFGAFFLCFIGLTFLLSSASGVVIYGPFMRRLPFGTVRRQQGPRARWLDLHNLTGITIALWLVVVGGTGVINTLATQIAIHWQRTELADMIAPWRTQPPPAQIVSPQHAVDAATAAAPNMKLSSIAVPGNPFAGPHHYAVFFRGRTPLTARILKPVLVDAATGTVTDTRDLPWYAQMLFVSQPLHFGDYGGLPLKIVWGLLDLVTIFVLCSGLYLWATRRESQFEMLIAAVAGATGVGTSASTTVD